MDKTIGIVGIAAYHSIFNIVNTILLFPFSKVLVKIAHLIVKETDEEQEFKLDERLMLTPPIAVAECSNSVTKMITKAREGLDKATMMLLNGYNEEDYNFIKKNEELVDGYEDHIGSYLMTLTTTHHLSSVDKNKSSKMLQAIGEIERIADHANYMANSAEELETKQLSFSEGAQDELNRIINAVREVYTLSLDCYLSDKADKADEVGPLRIVISEMCDAFKASHVERLAEGTCTAEQGFVFNDILYSCGRIADHSMNIVAIAYRSTHLNTGNSSTYMHDFKQRKDHASEMKYEHYLKKYMLAESKAAK